MRFREACTVLAGYAGTFVLVVAASFPTPALAQAWLYVSMGDSLAVGIWALRGYVPRYQSYARTDNPGKTISLRNLAQSGWTSEDLLNALRTDPNFQNSVKDAEIISFDIGGNDFRRARDDYKSGNCGDEECLRSALGQFVDNWNDILAELMKLRTGNAIIRTMDLYNPYIRVDRSADTYPGDNRTDLQVFKWYVDAANFYIGKTSKDNGIGCAPVYAAFNGTSGLDDPRSKGFISFDGLHPNDTGHNKMATLLRELGYAPLGVPRTGSACNTQAPAGFVEWLTARGL